jgi:N utilization substance protein A
LAGAVVQVAEDQQSLAIGRGGQNVRLAARLTGWKIDIRSTGGQQVAGTEEGGVKIPQKEEVQHLEGENAEEKLADIAEKKEEMEDEMDAAEPAPAVDEEKKEAQ